MIRAKNYKTVINFVKVMPRILWPLFSRPRCMWLLLLLSWLLANCYCITVTFIAQALHAMRWPSQRTILVHI